MIFKAKLKVLSRIAGLLAGWAAIMLSFSPLLLASLKFLNSGVSSDLHSVYFADESTGVVVGDSGRVLFTADAGVSWTAQTSGTSAALRSVHFVNSSTGVAVGNDGAIIKTTNFGSTWTAVNSAVTEILYSVYLINISSAWAVGASGTILKSMDGGNSWVNGKGNGVPVSGIDLKSVFFINSSTGWVCGNSGNVWITQNGGADWSALTSGVSNNLNSIFFINRSTGFLVGNNGVVMMSTSSGNTWQSIYSTSTDYNAVHFASTEIGRFAGDSGAVVQSTDTGRTFTVFRATTSKDLYDLYYPTTFVGYYVGAGGIILKESTSSVDSASSELGVQDGSLRAINNLFDPSKNESTTIEYGIVNTGNVSVRIYSLQGREVRTMVNEQKVAGVYSVLWDGRNDTGELVASGIYLVHIEAAKFSKTQKIAVVK